MKYTNMAVLAQYAHQSEVGFPYRRILFRLYRPVDTNTLPIHPRHAVGQTSVVLQRRSTPVLLVSGADCFRWDYCVDESDTVWFIGKMAISYLQSRYPVKHRLCHSHPLVCISKISMRNASSLSIWSHEPDQLFAAIHYRYHYFLWLWVWILPQSRNHLCSTYRHRYGHRSISILSILVQASQPRTFRRVMETTDLVVRVCHGLTQKLLPSKDRGIVGLL